MKCPAAVLIVLLAFAPALLLADPPAEKRRTRATARPQQPVATTMDQGNNRFALDLYSRLRDKPGNLVLSPFSLSSALATASAGARGATRDQMHQTLQLPKGKLQAAPSRLLVKLQGSPHVALRGPADHPLTVANALWVQSGLAVRDAFRKLARKQSGAAFLQVDFKEGEKARQTINAWVEKQTRSRIKDVVPDGAVDGDTRLLLTNAIHFKADWLHGFDRKDTQEGAFHVSARSTSKARFMHQEGQFGYHETRGLQLLELPYRGKDLSMIVLLPKKVDGLPALEKALSVRRLAGCLKELRPIRLNVVLPSFRLASEFQLRTCLADMGMPLAFGREADFSGIDEKGSLRLSAVLHKASIDVNEQGTEASAVTGALVNAKSVTVSTKTFRADHPFLFLIQDNHSGTVLFLGRVARP
jgi:serpin B